MAMDMGNDDGVEVTEEDRAYAPDADADADADGITEATDAASAVETQQEEVVSQSGTTDSVVVPRMVKRVRV
jgi:hypothetical protein